MLCRADIQAFCYGWEALRHMAARNLKTRCLHGLPYVCIGLAVGAHKGWAGKIRNAAPRQPCRYGRDLQIFSTAASAASFAEGSKLTISPLQYET